MLRNVHELEGILIVLNLKNFQEFERISRIFHVFFGILVNSENLKERCIILMTFSEI